MVGNGPQTAYRRPLSSDRNVVLNTARVAPAVRLVSLALPRKNMALIGEYCAMQKIVALPLFGAVAIGLNAEVRLRQNAEALQLVNVIVVLDRSGSMAGSQIHAAKSAIITFFVS